MMCSSFSVPRTSVSSQNTNVSPTMSKQFSFRIFPFQPLQKRDEIDGVVAMLQATVTAHVKVADKVILLRQSAISVPCGSNACPARTLYDARFSERVAIGVLIGSCWGKSVGTRFKRLATRAEASRTPRPLLVVEQSYAEAVPRTGVERSPLIGARDRTAPSRIVR
jgi:hypothetical protein